MGLPRDSECHGIANRWNVYGVTSRLQCLWGYRRAEACRRAGLTEIEAIVEGVDDDNALIQALIENVQREDMSPLDTARGLKALKDSTGWTNREIAARGIISHDVAGNLLALLEQPQEIQGLLSVDQIDPSITPDHVRVTRRAINNDTDKIAVLRKAATEHLSRDQSRQVAESIAAAPSERAKERLLERPYSPMMHNPEFIRARCWRYVSI